MTVETKHPDTLEEAIEWAVERGAAFVAEVYGPDWYTKIDRSRLKLESGNYCILGQLEGRRKAIAFDEVPETATAVDVDLLLYNGYTDAEYEYDLDEWDEERAVQRRTAYGFVNGNLPYDGQDERGRQRTGIVNYPTLQAAWERKIDALMAGGHREV